MNSSVYLSCQNTYVKIVSMANQKKSKKVSKTKPRKKTFSVWVGILVVLVVAAVGILVIRFSNAGTEIYRLNDIDQAISCPVSNIVNVDLQVNGFKPIKQGVCRVDSSGVNITLPRSAKPNEKVCFWGKSSNWRDNLRLYTGGSTSKNFRVSTNGYARPNTVGIISCHKNLSGSDWKVMEMVSPEHSIDLTNVSYGY